MMLPGNPPELVINSTWKWFGPVTRFIGSWALLKVKVSVGVNA